MDQAPGTLSVAESIRQTLHAAMAADPNVVLLGESVGQLGGVFRTTQGLLETFGPERVIQTPLSENATVGMAIGMAMGGKRPVVELVGGAAGAYAQITRELAELSSAEFPLPVVLRIPLGELPGGLHTESLAGALLGLEGLSVHCPSTPAQAAHVLSQALQARGPTVILESLGCYGDRSDRAAQDGAAILRSGRDATLVSYGAGVQACLKLADSSPHEVGVIDLSRLHPLDSPTLAQALRESGRLILATAGPASAHSNGALGDRVLAELTRAAFLYLESPPVAVPATEKALNQALSSSLRF
ncbi:MAG: 2-oxoisovalerate dehydrogenase E1 component beta subunit [Cognaticolwellia sp.]|jgi:2-oxoisovalerate dehydrogenase E1 component beta subunit